MMVMFLDGMCNIVSRASWDGEYKVQGQRGKGRLSILPRRGIRC